MILEHKSGVGLAKMGLALVSIFSRLATLYLIPPSASLVSVEVTLTFQNLGQTDKQTDR